MTRELLADAIQEETSLKVCEKHTEAIHYDEPECPVCKVLKESKKACPEKTQP